MVSYNKYGGWWKGYTLSLGQNLFVRNPHPKKKKFDINYIHCCNHVTVEFTCRDLNRIELKQQELFRDEESFCYKFISGNFCFAIREAGDKLEFLKEQARLFKILLIGDTSYPINYTHRVALRVLNIPFNGTEVFMHRSIYTDRCKRGNKTYHHVHPPASPLYPGKGKDIFAQVEAYGRFYLDLLQLIKKIEAHLSEIYRKANFNPDAPEILDYTNFFSAYFTNDMQLAFKEACEATCKPFNRTNPLFSNPQFHSEIFRKLVEGFKKKVAADIGTAPDPKTLKFRVSRTYAALRKTLIKGNNYCRSLQERLFSEKAFASAHAAFEILNSYTQAFKEENHSNIDKYQVISIDIEMFEHILLKRFQEKSELVQFPEKYLVDKARVLHSCDEMLLEYGNEFGYARDVFAVKWIKTFDFISAQVTEEKFLTLTLEHISKHYLTFDHEAEIITVKDPEDYEYHFPIDFYRNYILKLYLRIEFHLNQRRQKIFDAVEIASPENKNFLGEMNLQEITETPLPGYKWNLSDTDFLELVTSIHLAGAIACESGKEISREELLAFFGKLLNIEIKDPDSKLSHATTRTRSKHPLLDKLAKCFANYCDKLEAKKFED